MVQNYIAFSGGKDSTAMLLHMIELDMPFDKILFADTGEEHPEVYDYIKKIETLIKRKIEIVKAEYDWDYYFYKKITRGLRKGEIRGFPFIVIPCWANRDLKLKPQQTICKKGIGYLGIASDEKHRIQKGTNLRYPLIDWGWTERICLEYLKKRNLENPLYKRYKRLGCWLCPKQPIKDLRYIFEEKQDLWKRLLKYEEDCPHGFKPGIKLKDYEYKWKHQMKLKTFLH